MTSKTPARLKRLALAIIVSQTILCSPLLIFAVLDPRVLVDNWDLYTILFIVPYLVSLIMWLYARRWTTNVNQ